MNTISPPPNTTRHPSPDTPSRQVATIPTPGPELATLEAGHQLEAVVTKAVGNGRFEIDTQFGQLTLHTRSPLPREAKLTLDVTQTGKSVQLVITEINGKPVPDSTPVNPEAQNTSADDGTKRHSSSVEISRSSEENSVPDPMRPVPTKQHPSPDTPSRQVATIPTPGPELATLEAGHQLEAVVTKAVGNGRFEIDTQFGQLTLHTRSPLPREAKLTLDVTQTGKSVQLVITEINGKPVPDSTPVNPEAQNTSAGFRIGEVVELVYLTPQSPITQVSDTLQVNSSIKNHNTDTAPLIGKHSGLQINKSNHDTKRSFFNISLNTLSVLNIASLAVNNLNAKTALRFLKGQAAIFAKNKKPVIATPPLSLSKQLLDSRYALTLVPGQRLQAKIIKINTPGNKQQSTDQKLLHSTTSGKNITGRVVVENNGQIKIIGTEVGDFLYLTQRSAPSDATITLAVLDEYNGRVSKAIPSISDLDPNRINTWPALTAAIDALETAFPNTYQQLVRATMPQFNAQLLKNMLIVIGALKIGNIQNWMGDAPIRALEQLNPILLSQIRDDFSRLAGESEDQLSNDWRTYFSPFLQENGIGLLRLLMRNLEDDENSDNKKNIKKTSPRFIVDIHLSNLGRIQLDGLVKSRQKKIELIIRSDQLIEKRVQTKIQEIFSEAEEIVGFSGSVSFRSRPANFFNAIITKKNQSQDLNV